MNAREAHREALRIVADEIHGLMCEAVMSGGYSETWTYEEREKIEKRLRVICARLDRRAGRSSRPG